MPCLDSCLSRPSTRRKSPIAVHILAAASFAWLLYDGVGTGWSHLTTDFPNYYTAARMMLARVPLSSLYDYPAFQHEIGRTGSGLQLGGYVPQTPLAMLPVTPLWRLDPLRAKHAWLLLNLGFLALTLWLLSRIVRLNIAQLWLIVFLGYGALRQNFVLGQYYLLLLVLLTAAVYWLLRLSDQAAGGAFALALMLKLYGAPFLLFLIAKRRLRAVLAMIIILALGISVTIALFGWNDVSFYCLQILPRSMAGETLDPYHPANNSFATLFRRLFVAEPSLNPHPLVDSPPTFAFFQFTFSSLVLLLPILAARRNPGVIAKMEFAWWSIALLLLSPNTASYTFCLLVLPIVLRLDELPPRRWLYILLPYLILTLPLRPSWILLFPKAWLLLGLYIGVGYRFLKAIPRIAFAVAVTIAVAAGTAATFYAITFPETPATDASEIVAFPGNIDSNSPAVSASGVFYESIAGERYVIRQWDGNAVRTWNASGHAFHPSITDGAGRVYFELDSGERSSIAFFDLATGCQTILPIDFPEPYEPAVSPDGSDVAFIARDQLYLLHGGSLRKLHALLLPRDPSFAPDSRSLVYVAGPNRSKIARLDPATGENTILVDSQSQLAGPSLSPDSQYLLYAALGRQNSQLWLTDLASRRSHQLTEGRCNSWAPAWAGCSNQVIFASDCKRGLHLPALFRLSVNLPE